MKEVSVGRADVIARSCERPASQHLLPDKPLVVVLVEVRFEAWIGNVIGSRPFPNVADHLMTTVLRLACGKCADGRDAPEAVFEEICF